MALTSEYIKSFSIEKGIDFVGIGLPERFGEAPVGHHPSDLLKSVRSVIVCGKVVPTGALLSQGTLYHKAIEMTHLKLDQTALMLAEEIEKNGGVAVPISTHAPYYYWDEERQYAHGELSIKHAAEAAGLGKIGKSSIFISKDYGVLTRMVCILTDIALEPDFQEEWEPCPEGCSLCIESCPVNAIKQGCICEQGLCRENLFKKTLKGVQFEDCRECLKVCPWVLERSNKTENQEAVRDLDIGRSEKQGNVREKILISTLGPEGTCSEYASQYYIDKNNYDGKINLYSSFEEAIVALKDKKSDYVIIPSAYRNFADIIFIGKHTIEIIDAFVLDTPNLVIANMGYEREVRKVATHSSPSSLAKCCFPDAQLVIAKSNSNAAELLLANEVDACITTIKCAEMHSLNIIHDYGSITMGWNVLGRK